MFIITISRLLISHIYLSGTPVEYHLAVKMVPMTLNNPR